MLVLLNLESLLSPKIKVRTISSFRSSHQRCSRKKGVLRNFAKFTGKHLCQSLFFNKAADLSPATISKKRLWHRCFPVNFTRIFKNAFFTKHSWTAASFRHLASRCLP